MGTHKPEAFPKSTAEIAKDVYTSILEGEHGFDNRQSVHGLHNAVCNLRVQKQLRVKNDLLIWVPFIHLGV